MPPEDRARRRSMLGVAAYLLVPGERRSRAAGHFGRAAIEAARGVRTLYVPTSSGVERRVQVERPGETGSAGGGRQRIEIQ